MPKVKTTMPPPSREKGQRSLDLPDIYFNRILPLWRQPEWFHADMWRNVVASQPFAMVAKDTIIQNVLALDWKIEPRDSTQRDELKSDIDYYTKFFENNGNYDYTQIIEWIGSDLLDLPFGAAAELGRQSDDPNGRLIWMKLLDGGTLFPTLNDDWPVGQLLKEAPSVPVIFPAHAINRIYMSPRTWIRREGWGVAPPEKIYLALELLNRGDYYYANLLLDTPEVGILDLGDMEKSSAAEWVDAWKSLLGGIDPFKVPVLYEHTSQAKFISFSRSPTEMMFDKATMKYAAILAAGYGLSLSDIGIQAVTSGGETLAGSIRQERRTRKTGVGIVKKKFKYFFDRILPAELSFNFIDLDDEVSVAIGRSRLANATAWGMLIDKRIFTPEEARQQTIADGLVSISVPEEVPADSEFPEPQAPFGQSPERPSMLGRPVAPSAGGQGEVRSDVFSSNLNKVLDIDNTNVKRSVRAAISPLLMIVKSALDKFGSDIDLNEWYAWQDHFIWDDDPSEDISEETIIRVNVARENLKKSMSGWIKDQLAKFDFNDVYGELYDLFAEIRLQRMKKKAELDYEHGVIDKIPDEFPEFPLADKYKAAIKRIISSFDEDIPKIIENSVISGVFHYLSMQNNIETLDIDAILVDNYIVRLIKDEIEKSKSALIYDLGTKISMEINQLLLEDK